MRGEELRKDVLAWMEENHRSLVGRAHEWRYRLAERLTTHEYMRGAWRELAKPNRETMGRRVMSFAIQALEDAHKECRRATTSHEEERIDAVRRALSSLRKAIERAPSPYFDVAHIDIAINEQPVAFSWRASGAKASENFKPVLLPVCLDECLELAEKLLAGIERSRPARTVSRQRADPLLAAFVHHLAARFNHEYGLEMKGTVASIAMAALDREIVTKEHVERILRTTPPH